MMKHTMAHIANQKTHTNYNNRKVNKKDKTYLTCQTVILMIFKQINSRIHSNKSLSVPYPKIISKYSLTCEKTDTSWDKIKTATH
jgi:hypothetical protein